MFPVEESAFAHRTPPYTEVLGTCELETPLRLTGLDITVLSAVVKPPEPMVKV
jgi:hypothetical protein